MQSKTRSRAWDDHNTRQATYIHYGNGRVRSKTLTLYGLVYDWKKVLRVEQPQKLTMQAEENCTEFKWVYYPRPLKNVVCEQTRGIFLSKLSKSDFPFAPSPLGI